MTAFLLAHWSEILLSLITAGALAFCRGFWKRMKEYQKMVDEKKDEETETLIDSKIQPLIEDIEELRRYIHETADIEKHHLAIIVSSYRFRLIALCKTYIKQGYMTQDQYDQLTEFYKVYENLGGNGQAKQYYDKAVNLEVK